MSWALLGRTIRLAFYLRVPLLTLALLAAIGPLGHDNKLIANLFDQQNDAGAIGWNVFNVSFAAFLVAFAAITTLNLTLYYGSERFGESMAQSRPSLTFTVGVLSACSLIATTIWRTEGRHLFLKVGLAVAAFAAAMGFTLVAKIVQMTLTNPSVTQHPPPYLVFPAYRWIWLDSQFNRLYCWPSKEDKSFSARFVRGLKEGTNGVSQWPLRIFDGAGQGYLARVDQRLVLQSGHVFALTLAILAFFFYLAMGFGKQYIVAAPAIVSGLAYVLLYVLVACWTLSALCFFLDRYRFPLLLSVVVLASLTGSTPESDHFFRVETEKDVIRLAEKYKYPTPHDYLAERLKDEKRSRLIMVATPGGGIQAAAWTATVLSGLDKHFKDHPAAHTFRDSVAMISSVSGGSLGAMIYAASFQNGMSDECVSKTSMRSAIDEVAWGLTTPDFWRAVIPLFRPNLTVDRGWALEQKWAVINGLSPEPPLPWANRAKNIFGDCAASRPNSNSPENDTYLSDWARKRTALPALVLNSTLVESGEHVVFSTTQFPTQADTRGIRNFYDIYKNEGKHFDVRVNTAVRVSASFPYVAPAARPLNLRSIYEKDFHYVDGGYYDNLGIDSAIGWLNEAFSPEKPNEPPLPVKEIMLIQIRHFNPDVLNDGSEHGWGFQSLAPLLGLLNMWNSAPGHRDSNELDLFQQKLQDKGISLQTVTIPYCGLNGSASEEPDYEKCMKASLPPNTTIDFQQVPAYNKSDTNCASQPLSWKLSQSQKECIKNGWKRMESQDPTHALDEIRKFLNE